MRVIWEWEEVGSEDRGEKPGSLYILCYYLDVIIPRIVEVKVFQWPACRSICLAYGVITSDEMTDQRSQTVGSINKSGVS